MAKIGLKKFVWAEFATEPDNAAPTYETPIVVGKMVSVNVSFTKASGEFYADDEVTERIDDVVSGELTPELDHISLENQAVMTGATYDSTSGEIVDKNSDSPPYGGCGGYQVLLKNGVKIFRAYFFPKTKASLPDESGNTKTNSPSFGTQEMPMTVLYDNAGRIRLRKDFTGDGAETNALAWVYTKMGASL